MANDYWRQVAAQRLSRRRALAVTGGASLSVALLAACGSSGGGGEKSGGTGLVSVPVDTSNQARRGGVLKWLWKADPPSLDPAFGTTNNRTPKNLANSLLLQKKPGHLGAATPEVIPDLAEAWEISPDKTSLTFKMRQGVKWHNLPPVNGRLLDVEDILFSWDRLLRIGSHRAEIANAVNPEAPVVSVKAPDSKTIVITLSKPVSYILSVLADQVGGWFAITPKEADSTLDLRRTLLGTGPFMLTDYTPSVGLTYKRNPDYFLKDRPYVDGIEMPIVPEYATQLAQFRTGAIYTMAVTKENILTQKRDIPEMNLVSSDMTSAGGSQTAFGWLPAGKSPFLDQRVRQALSMSWDRDLFIEAQGNIKEFESEGLPITTRWNTAITFDYEGYWLDPKSKAFGPNAKYYQHDPVEAKKLLTAAGYPNGLDVSEFFQANTDSKPFEILGQFASEIGIRVSLKPIDPTTGYLPLRDSMGQFEGLLGKTAPSPFDPIAAFASQYSLKGGTVFAGFNVNGKSDPTGDPLIESLIDKGLAEYETDRREAIAVELQRYLAEKMYFLLPPGASSGFSIAWPALRNFGVFRGDSDQIPTYWWLDDTQPPIKKA